jgi:hypothetical protein
MTLLGWNIHQSHHIKRQNHLGQSWILTQNNGFALNGFALIYFLVTNTSLMGFGQ